MIRYQAGNLLEADTKALVNTVNTVGVMGKGIALMFKEAFPDNFKSYEAACKRHEVQVGRMFVTERHDMYGPRWIINFPTKQHWRNPSKLDWVVSGLCDLRSVIVERGIASVALPPLGAGNGGLDWSDVKLEIERSLQGLDAVDIVVFEPTRHYHNAAKRKGVTSLTPARAIIAELIVQYCIPGIECSLLEVQKLAWFAQASIERSGLANPLKLDFRPFRYGPYADKLRHMLDGLDGSYLRCEKRISDAGAFEPIWFDNARQDHLRAYFMMPEAAPYKPAVDAATAVIDGFQSPLGMELLATVDWLIRREGAPPTIEGVQQGIRQWPGDGSEADRKLRILSPRLLQLALDHFSALARPAPAA